jgi:hypothetical protein
LISAPGEERRTAEKHEREKKRKEKGEYEVITIMIILTTTTIRRRSHGNTGVAERGGYTPESAKPFFSSLLVTGYCIRFIHPPVNAHHYPITPATTTHSTILISTVQSSTTRSTYSRVTVAGSGRAPPPSA